MNFFKRILLFTTILILFSFNFGEPLGWYKSGSKPECYDMGVEKGAGQDGGNAASIKSIVKKISGFGTLMQNLKPDKYLGKKIKLTGFIKSKDVSVNAGFWINTTQGESGYALTYANTDENRIKGTTDWTRLEIVISVPKQATNILFGGVLQGTGQIWFDNLKLEIVDDSVPTTGNYKAKQNRPINDEPTNLDFEK